MFNTYGSSIGVKLYQWQEEAMQEKNEEQS